MIRAALFDIDGTLVDSNDLHVQAWQRAFRHYGKEISAEAIHHQVGKGGDQLLPVFLSPDEVKRFGEALRDHRAEIFARDYLPHVQPFPGVRPLFERLRAEGIAIALASSSPEHEVDAHTARLGVADLLAAATSADDAEHSKPCPDIFAAAAARIAVAPSAALVVGDTPYDGLAARRAGMRMIGVLSGGFPETELRDAGAIEIYRDVADLVARYDATVFARERPRRR